MLLTYSLSCRVCFHFLFDSPCVLLLVLLSPFSLFLFFLFFFFFFYFFFISNRRRHTRCLSDWSSDVCSSDLDSPQFEGAPIYLREALVFPYRYGLDFEAALLKQGGKEKAFAGVFKNPPRSTREIMEPETYLNGEHLKAMPLPDFDKVFKGYELFDIGAVGEFDVAMLIDQFAGAEASKDMYPHWRGGYYYAVKSKADPAAPLGLMYASRWSDPDSAANFAAIYAKSLSERYKRA